MFDSRRGYFYEALLIVVGGDEPAVNAVFLAAFGFDDSNGNVRITGDKVGVKCHGGAMDGRENSR